LSRDQERVVDRDGKKAVDLKALSGKRIRFKGYLLKEPTLVMVDSAPTVVSPCRGPQKLPESELSISDALHRSKEIPASKSVPPGDALAAVVEALDPPLHSGMIAGHALLSHRFRTVKRIHGGWPDTFVIHYRASIDANERAIARGEVRILIPKRDKRDKTFAAGKFLPDTPKLRKRVTTGR